MHICSSSLNTVLHKIIHINSDTVFKTSSLIKMKTGQLIIRLKWDWSLDGMRLVSCVQLQRLPYLYVKQFDVMYRVTAVCGVGRKFSKHKIMSNISNDKITYDSGWTRCLGSGPWNRPHLRGHKTEHEQSGCILRIQMWNDKKFCWRCSYQTHDRVFTQTCSRKLSYEKSLSSRDTSSGAG
jgi:hypothetical protein